MDGLRTELSAIVERSRIGDRKQQELEQVITRLEDEVARHSSQTIQLEERLADKMAQIASLESKLGQRNLKVVDLQNELEEKISENNVLQREVRNLVGSFSNLFRLTFFFLFLGIWELSVNNVFHRIVCAVQSTATLKLPFFDGCILLGRGGRNFFARFVLRIS